MDPYLEDPAFWQDFHERFLARLCDTFADLLPDNYEARIDERGSPDVAESYIRLLRRPERSLVTVVELLSPSNKVQPGRGEYLAKRNAFLRQDVHLVEFDWLVGGERLPMGAPLPPGDYYTLVSRADRRDECEVYAWCVRQPIPSILVPLRAPDSDMLLDLQTLFTQTYDRCRYRRALPYFSPPSAPLSEADGAWARQVSQGA